MQTTRRQFLKTTAGVSAAAMLGSLTRCSPGKRPNVLLIFSDELAPDFLGCYGGTDYPSEHIDQLAETGMKFTSGYSAAPQCTPSRFSVLSGVHPGRCKHPDFLNDFPTDTRYSIAWNTYLTEDLPTVAGVLSANGYVTGMAGKVHFAKLPEDMEEPQFDPDADPADPEVNEKLQQHQQVVSEYLQRVAGFDECRSVAMDNLDMHPIKALRHHNFPWMTKGAVDFIEEHAGSEQPFFLYVATTAVHGPYHPEQWNYDLRYTPEGYLEDVPKYMIPKEDIMSQLQSVPNWQHHRYAGMACLNNHVKILLNKLDELGIAEETMVIFTADHNIEPGKATCYQKGHVVPTLLRWPGHIPAGSSTDALMQNIDLMPTILQAAGANQRPETDGVELQPLFDDPQTSVRDYVYLECGYARGITDGKYKYIALRFPDDIIERMKSGDTQYAANYIDRHKQAHSQIAIEHFPHYFDPDQFYDLEKDPYEQNNVVNESGYAKEVERLKSALDNYLDRFEHPYSLEPIPFMTSDRYKELAANTRAIGTDYIGWLPRDHGAIVYPPEE